MTEGSEDRHFPSEIDSLPSAERTLRVAVHQTVSLEIRLARAEERVRELEVALRCAEVERDDRIESMIATGSRKSEESKFRPTRIRSLDRLRIPIDTGACVLGKPPPGPRSVQPTRAWGRVRGVK